MRYNGGGLLDIASELAYMVSSPAATTGTVFERMQFNSKNPFHLTAAQMRRPSLDFAAVSRPGGQPLPQLGSVARTVLTGPTCAPPASRSSTACEASASRST